MAMSSISVLSFRGGTRDGMKIPRQLCCFLFLMGWWTPYFQTVPIRFVEAFAGLQQLTRAGVQKSISSSSRNASESDGPWADFSLLPSKPDTGDRPTIFRDHSESERPHNVRFMSPLLDYGYPPTVEEFEDGSLAEKPLLLYLPGFDGTYICPFIQFPELGTEFELWCMTVGMNDRSTFTELKDFVLDFLRQYNVKNETTATVPAITEAIPPPQSSSNVTTGNKSQATENKGQQPFWSSWFTNEDSVNKSSRKTSPNDKKSKRPLYLAGESFGGILASEISLCLLEEAFESSFDLKGLVLINPATCYDRSQLAAKGPSIAKLPSLLYPFGLTTLLPLFTDTYSVEQLLLILQAKALPSVIDDPIRESYMGRVAFSLPTKLEYMSQGTLTWRLKEWLDAGCEMMTDRMRDFRRYKKFRTLLLVGEKDLTLPSIAEAERLANLLPNSQIHVVEGAGHASTCGSRLDLAAQMRKTFIELRNDDDVKDKRKAIEQKKDNTTTINNKKKNRDKRIAMKAVASAGVGPYFGMEPRYDGANIGLNPILYWATGNYRAVKASIEAREVISDEKKNTRRVYRKVLYRPMNRRGT